MSRRPVYDPRDPLDRAPARRGGLLGGTPVATILRLGLACLIVGALMQGLDLTPRALLLVAADLLAALRDAVEAALGNGVEALLTLGRWLLYGAVIVVPLFLLSRLRR